MKWPQDNVCGNGDRASEVSQNFGRKSSAQNFEVFTVHVKHFTREWDLGSAPAMSQMEVRRPACKL